MGEDIDAVVGIESRGFILGAAVANALGCGFVPVRKPGKLPSKTVKETYTSSTAPTRLEIHDDAVAQGQRVLIVDDVLATGGTAEAAAKLVKAIGGDLRALAFLIELNFLNGPRTAAGGDGLLGAAILIEGKRQKAQGKGRHHGAGAECTRGCLRACLLPSAFCLKIDRPFAPVAQGIEHPPPKRGVGSSILPGRARSRAGVCNDGFFRSGRLVAKAPAPRWGRVIMGLVGLGRWRTSYRAHSRAGAPQLRAKLLPRRLARQQLPQLVDVGRLDEVMVEPGGARSPRDRAPAPTRSAR